MAGGSCSVVCKAENMVPSQSFPVTCNQDSSWSAQPKCLAKCNRTLITDGLRRIDGEGIRVPIVTNQEAFQLCDRGPIQEDTDYFTEGMTCTLKTEETDVCGSDDDGYVYKQSGGAVVCNGQGEWEQESDGALLTQPLCTAVYCDATYINWGLKKLDGNTSVESIKITEETSRNCSTLQEDMENFIEGTRTFHS